MAELRAAAAGVSNVPVIDIADFFCTASTCLAMKGGYALYWDSHRVSYTAATAYAIKYSANEAKIAIKRPESFPGDHASKK
jgi:hypothetical protein